MKVIIGAGPAGLYAAIKLRQAGVRDIVIYDPRAGVYTRPGHLNKNAIKQAEDGIGVKFGLGTAHIKDLERQLYSQIQRLHIKIENKRFVRLHQDAKAPGVVIMDDKDVEEFVEADYVFDCTGTRRNVVAAVNSIVPDSPLKLTTITDVPVANHLLAYVKMDKADFTRFNEAKSELSTNALTFAQSIIKLRALGWKEFKLPRCYGQDFPKDKACLYFHAPEHLAKENYDLWVKTVLESYVKPISYEHVKPSRKFASKPRFIGFSVEAKALEKVSYKGVNLPTVIALGDAQIDYDYALAHGIFNGMKRIDALIEHMEFIDGKIYYFDADEYLLALRELLRDHKAAVKTDAETKKIAFASALPAAKLILRKAIDLSTDAHEKSVINSIIMEIDARQSYTRGHQLFDEYHDAAHKLKPISVRDKIVISKFESTQAELLEALSALPASFDTERKIADDLLVHLVDTWKTVGSALITANRLPEAANAYKRAIEIYNLTSLKDVYDLKRLSLFSNLAIVYNKAKHYAEAIAIATDALDVYGKCPPGTATSLLEKIIFNLINAICAQAQECFLSKHTEDANLLHQRARGLIATHASSLTVKTYPLLQSLITELQLRLVSNIALKSSEPASVAAPATATVVSTTPVAEPPAKPAAAGAVVSSTSTKNSSVLKDVGLFATNTQPPRVTPVGKDTGCCVVQ